MRLRHFLIVAVLALSASIAISFSGENNTNPSVTHDSVAPATTSSGTTTLLFVGDMFFDRYIRTMSRVHGEEHLFSCADTLLKSADAVIGNLEGPITDEPSTSEGTVIGSPENYRFTFPSTTAALLYRHNIRVVDLGNNHIANYGSDGINATHRYLDSAHVGYFGGVNGDEPILEEEISGIPFSFISYNGFYGTSSFAVAEKIKHEKAKGRTVIVFAHWGTEYSTSTLELHERAALFATSGASLIVGAHPHIVLPSELIGDVPVYYSLGNFIFDQYWSAEVSHGLVLEVDFTGTVPYVKEHYVDLHSDGRSCVN